MVSPRSPVRDLSDLEFPLPSYLPVFYDKLNPGDLCATTYAGRDRFEVIGRPENLHTLFNCTMYRLPCRDLDSGKIGSLVFRPGAIAYIETD